MATTRTITRRAALAAGAALTTGLTLRAKQEKPAPQPEGYTDQLSYAPGDRVQFHVSGASGYSIEVARLGAKREVVWRKDDLPALKQPIPADADSHGCRWKPTAEIVVGDDW